MILVTLLDCSNRLVLVLPAPFQGWPMCPSAAGCAICPRKIIWSVPGAQKQQCVLQTIALYFKPLLNGSTKGQLGWYYQALPSSCSSSCNIWGDIWANRGIYHVHMAEKSWVVDYSHLNVVILLLLLLLKQIAGVESMANLSFLLILGDQGIVGAYDWHIK